MAIIHDDSIKSEIKFTSAIIIILSFLSLQSIVMANISPEIIEEVYYISGELADEEDTHYVDSSILEVTVKLN